MLYVIWVTYLVRSEGAYQWNRDRPNLWVFSTDAPVSFAILARLGRPIWKLEFGNFSGIGKPRAFDATFEWQAGG